jgi:hypothetical protein
VGDVAAVNVGFSGLDDDCFGVCEFFCGELFGGFSFGGVYFVAVQAG